MRRIFFLVITFLIVIISTAHAAPRYGVTYTYPIIGKDPYNMSGYRGAVWYQPQSLVWKRFQIYFDLSYAHWYVTKSSLPNGSIGIYAIAPNFRYYFAKLPDFEPYVELGIGASYLTRTRFDDRNLGMHFAFQDVLGFGAAFGKSHQLTVELETMHYSNGSLCSMNAGITIPLLINVGYGFG